MNQELETTWLGHDGCVRFAKAVAVAVADSMDLQQPNNGALVIRLDGTLGAGKTYFTQQFAKELGAIDGEVTSPTFVIIQLYDTSPRISHLDLYRVNDDDEFFELGIDEMFEQPEVMLIEWGGKFTHLLPKDHLSIQIDIVSEQNRVVRLKSYGLRSDALLKKLQGY